MGEREELENFGELIAATEEAEKQGPLISPLPACHGDFDVCFDDGDDLNEGFEALGRYVESWQAGLRAWMASPAPVFIRIIGKILCDMPPMLPNNARLTSYYEIRDMVDHGQFTLMQKDAMRAMMSLFVLQVRPFVQGEYERAEQRIRSVIASMLHDSAIWDRQIKEEKISLVRLDAREKATKASIKYSKEEKQAWSDLYLEKKQKNPSIEYTEAARSIAKERELEGKSIHSIRKHLSKNFKN